MRSVVEGELLWTPRPDFAASSNVARYLEWLRRNDGPDLADYGALWRWSVEEPERFWGSLWAYFKVESETPFHRVLDRRTMPGARWFEGSRVNYAEHLLRHERIAADDEIALHHLTETRELRATTWHELGRQVRIVATRLRAMGVQPGDHVVAYMPNTLETAIAMMATVAVGAVWSSAAPEFGVRTVIDRFMQIEPKVLFAVDGYRFGGKDFSRVDEVRQICGALPSLRHVVSLSYLSAGPAEIDCLNTTSWDDLIDHPDVPASDFRFERVDHDHPLWVLFSSGTTGLPKAIVHSHVGTLIEHLKVTHFHLNLKRGSVMFFYSTTGWMMWNALLSALLQGASAVLYDGSPVHPEPDALWSIAARTRTTSFGASPTFVQIMEKAGLRPIDKYDLGALESVLVSGAPSTPETFVWFYENVKRDLWVTSQSGGTEIVSGFVGATPTLPVFAGEIQTRMLGMDVRAWDDNGKDLSDQVGELIVLTPFPSMPIYFWGDPEGRRYHESYFDAWPGVWKHGDFIRINERGGCYIYGRSDSTLNRHGVRIGTAEIYRAIEQLPEIADSLIVCCERPGGKFFMPLFIKLRPDVAFDDGLPKRIALKLREDCSPRHVPDKIYLVEHIPYTLTGKKMEVPVRKILMGWSMEKAASRDAMMNPEAIDWFVAFARDITRNSFRA